MRNLAASQPIIKTADPKIKESKQEKLDIQVKTHTQADKKTENAKTFRGLTEIRKSRNRTGSFDLCFNENL